MREIWSSERTPSIQKYTASQHVFIVQYEAELEPMEFYVSVHCAPHSVNILYIVCNLFFYSLSFSLFCFFFIYLFRSGPFGRIKLLTPTSLVVNRVGRDDKGMYQCSVTNKRSSAQAMAELKLGGKLLLCSAQIQPTLSMHESVVRTINASLAQTPYMDFQFI